MTTPAEREPAHVSVLGATLSLKGELSANEELLIRGRLEGTIAEAGHVTVTAEGSVKADMRAESVIIEGSVEGNVHARQSVTVKVTAKVRGNLHAPAVSIEPGANFNGGIVMDGGSAPAVVPAAAPAAVTAAAPAATAATAVFPAHPRAFAVSPGETQR